MFKKLSIFALLVVTAFTLSACSDENPEALAEATAVAEWLTQSGAKMYGAFWCPHCADQKELFGSAFNEVEYIECSTPDRRSQTQVCRDADISAYPTWEFGDGTRVEDVLSLRELKEYSGFPEPGDTAGPQVEQN